MKRRDLAKGCREFSCEEPGYANFRPNLSPGEVLQAGAFGGTYFRDIEIEGVKYKGAWKEFASPATDWFDGLNIPLQVASQKYRPGLNRYKVKSGQDLEAWLEKGWILPEYDSHGQFHWYCRFFLGRRSKDDPRQISRWLKCAGETGRWRRNLIAKCVRAGKSFDDYSVSPVVRQTLLHWAYELNEKDFNAYARQVKAGAKTSFIPTHTMKHIVDAEGSASRAVATEDSDSESESKKKEAKQSAGRRERATKRARRN